jgi:hypothetical protein
MTDETLFTRIERLVNEEHELRHREETERAHEQALTRDRERLTTIETELDRCWDLLRQRRALRKTGADPDLASQRDSETIENYLQ